MERPARCWPGLGAGASRKNSHAARPGRKGEVGSGKGREIREFLSVFDLCFVYSFGIKQVLEI